MGKAELCASCHTIVLPVYDASGKQVGTDFEQTTYFEWLNSSFASKNQPCQNCHMRDNFNGVPLAVPNRQHRGQHIPNSTRHWSANIVAG